MLSSFADIALNCKYGGKIKNELKPALNSLFFAGFKSFESFRIRLKGTEMADVDDLNEEEFRLPTNDRLSKSKKKRAQQLKKYAQYEKQVEKENGKRSKKTEKSDERKKDKKVRFPGSVTLLEASARDDRDEVKRLLRIGISPDACNDDGLTALHQCCIDDTEEMMIVLLDFGAKVNATDCELWTPLHAAATCGRIELCRRLIEHGADLLAVNGDGNMPYDICEHEATLDYIEFEMAKQGITQDLIDETRLIREKVMLSDLKDLHHKNGDLEFRGRNGETPLHIAAANGYLDVADFLLSHRVRVDSVDNDLWQPIHCAACWGQLTVLELLLEHGASLEAKTSSGSTALDMCEDVEMRQKILEIKEEIENSRISKSREISRRHSSTIRRSHLSRGASVMYNSNAALDKSPLSASVRRTSMREKNEMSWKDAKEEARKMRESSELGWAKQDMEDEDENGLGSQNQSNKAPKSSMLTPLVSVDEILDVQIDTKNERNTQDDLPSPGSPEPLLGRGINFDVPTSQVPVSSMESTTKPKINGLPPCTTAAIGGSTGMAATLHELKKQRSHNRLPEARANDLTSDLVENAKTPPEAQPSTSADSGKIPNAQAELHFCDPLLDSSKPPLLSQGKAAERRVDFGRRCCVII